MEKAGSKRSKRSPTFTPEEVAILVDEVWQHHEVLFRGTKGKKDIASKNRIWQAIAKKMSPCSPCGLRDWCSVRKKWQEFQSLTKKKSAKLRQESMGTGGGAPGDTTLTPDEKKVLSIIEMTSSEGISGDIYTYVLGDEGLSENGEEEEPSGSGAATCTSPGEDDSPQPSPVPARRPAGPGVRTWGGVRRPSKTTCTCGETLVCLERKKLAVLRRIECQLEMQTALQEDMVCLKRQKLELHRRQLALAEAQFNSPSISVPVILPQVPDDADDQ